LFELKKQYLLDKKNHSRNFPSSRNQTNKKGEKNYDIGHFEFPIAKFAVFTKESFGQIRFMWRKRISEVQTKINNIINQEKVGLTDKVTVNENELARRKIP
jgi:hypothetical protein